MVKSFFLYLGNLDSRLCVIVSTYTGKRYLDKSMYYITRSGDGPLYAIVALLMLIFAFDTGFLFLVAGSLAFVIEIVIQKLIKHKVKRQRPGASVKGIRFLVSPPDQFSFPSGHTAGAFIMGVLTLYFFPFLTIPVFMWAGLMGFSRIYNGVHFPTDVFAGALLGIVSAFGAILIVI